MEIYRQGYDVPVLPGVVKGAVSWFLPPSQSVVNTATTGVLAELLYSPESWSSEVNTDFYELVAFVLQASQELNITVPGGKKYNVPTENITIGPNGGTSVPTLTSYSPVAIVGADDFVDSGVTIKDVFDIVVNVTREVTPTCRFSVISSRSFNSLTVTNQVGTVWSFGWVRERLSSGNTF